MRDRRRRPKLPPIRGRLAVDVVTDVEVLIRSIAQQALACSPEASIDPVPEALHRFEGELARIAEAEVQAVASELQKGQPRGVRVEAPSVRCEGKKLVSSVAYRIDDLKMLPLIRGAEGQRPFRSLRFERDGQVGQVLWGRAFEDVVADPFDPQASPELGFGLALDVECSVPEHDAHTFDAAGGQVRLRWWFALNRAEPAHIRLRLAPASV